MRTWNETMTRRSVLQLGLSAAALLAVPPMRWVAKADPTNPHFLVMLFSDGGWDPTQTLDVHDPLDATDGIDVDVPEVISGLPPSQIATVGGITYMSNPTTRPAVDTFFQTWAARTCVVNGINTRSTSHDQSRQLVLTGSLDPTRAGFVVIAAHRTGDTPPLSVRAGWRAVRRARRPALMSQAIAKPARRRRARGGVGGRTSAGARVGYARASRRRCGRALPAFTTRIAPTLTRLAGALN
jgi:hypothetical protein